MLTLIDLSLFLMKPNTPVVTDTIVICCLSVDTILIYVYLHKQKRLNTLWSDALNPLLLPIKINNIDYLN